MEAAEQIAANAMQGGLFDIPGELPRRWSITSRCALGEQGKLKEEKLAIGFSSPPPPSNAFRDEVRRFVRRPLAQVEPSRDVVTMAGGKHGGSGQDDRPGQDPALCSG